MNKDKLVQIYETVADMTIERLSKLQGQRLALDEFDIDMISATLQLYNAISNNQQKVEIVDLDKIKKALNKEIKMNGKNPFMV